MVKSIYVIVFLGFVFFLWEMTQFISSDLALVLPLPSRILLQIFNYSDRFFFHTKATLSVMAGGFLLASFVAFPLAWIMEIWAPARLTLQPLFIIVQCIPMFVLAPIIVLWFGWSYTSLLIPTALMIFFPLTINIFQGIRSTPKDLINFFISNKATPWQLFYKLQLPWALPHIFGGFRIAAAIAGIGAIAGEWAGAQSGLGMLMLESRRGADLEMMFGALFCLTFVSLFLYGTITMIEYQFFKRKFPHLINRSLSCLLILLSLGLTSCNTPEENQTRLILDWLPNPNHVPLYVGIENGIFKEYGINLKILKITDPSSPLPFLTSGQSELAISYMPSVIRASLRGSKLKMVSVLIPIPLNSFIYRKDSNIHSLKDLNNKIIGYCIDGTATKCLDYLLSSNKINPKDKRNVSFDLVSTMGTKQVDLIYGAFWNIECEQLRFLNIETDYFSLTDFGMPNYFELMIMAKENSPQADPIFIDNFKIAIQKSINFCIKNPDKAFEIYLAYNPDKGYKTIQWEKKAWEKTYPILPKDQNFDDSTWKTFETWVINNNLM